MSDGSVYHNNGLWQLEINRRLIFCSVLVFFSSPNPPPRSSFCSRPMRSRDFPLALAFSRLEETEKTATQAIIGKTFSDDVECVSKTRSRNTKKWHNSGIINPLFDGLTYNTSGHFAHCWHFSTYRTKYPRVYGLYIAINYYSMSSRWIWEDR